MNVSQMPMCAYDALAWLRGSGSAPFLGLFYGQLASQEEKGVLFLNCRVRRRFAKHGYVKFRCVGPFLPASISNDGLPGRNQASSSRCFKV